jgi:hypothetical protein
LSTFDPSSFKDFSNVATPMELHDYKLPFKPIVLSFKVQAFVDVTINQPSSCSFIIFQSTCPTITIGQTFCYSLNVVVGQTSCPILDVVVEDVIMRPWIIQHKQAMFSLIGVS